MKMTGGPKKAGALISGTVAPSLSAQLRRSGEACVFMTDICNSLLV
jgi:hypothetical protein